MSFSNIMNVARSSNPCILDAQNKLEVFSWHAECNWPSMVVFRMKSLHGNLLNLAIAAAVRCWKEKILRNVSGKPKPVGCRRKASKSRECLVFLFELLVSRNRCKWCTGHFSESDCLWTVSCDIPNAYIFWLALPSSLQDICSWKENWTNKPISLNFGSRTKWKHMIVCLHSWCNGPL